METRQRPPRDLGEQVKEITNALIKPISTAAQSIIQTTIQTSSNVLNGSIASLSQTTQNVLTWGKNTSSTLVDATAYTWKSSSNLASYTWKAIAEESSALWRSAVNLTTNTAQQAKNVTTEIASDFKLMGGALWSDLKSGGNSMKDAGIGLWQDAKNITGSYIASSSAYTKQLWESSIEFSQNTYKQTEPARAQIVANAKYAWEKSAAKAQELAESEFGQHAKVKAVLLGARIAYEQLALTRRNDNPERFADILIKQNGDENFGQLITNDDGRFLALAYAQAVKNQERTGRDYPQKLIDAAKLYPAFEDNFAQALKSQIDIAFRHDNRGKSPEARQAYKSLSLMFNQVGQQASFTSRVDPMQLKQVHAAGKKMGYSNETSEILLYARRSNSSLMSAFKAQDIAGAVRTQKAELGVDELPEDMQPM